MKVVEKLKGFNVVEYINAKKGGTCIALIPAKNKGIAGAKFNKLVTDETPRKDLIKEAKAEAK